MERCDVAIVGGGPAGSSCAWSLHGRGLDVVVVDRSRFPRDKTCAGWVTPQVFRSLAIDPQGYASEEAGPARDAGPEKRTLQPLLGFRVRRIGDPEGIARSRDVVSYGIRRCEFDDYLLRRSGARLRLGEPLAALERNGERWVLNGSLEARFLVGAGGHFCPVARTLRKEAGLGGAEPVVAAQELEFALGDAQARRSPVLPELPEIYFTRDLRGYGWIFRKGRYLNVGLGRLDRGSLAAHVERFLAFLRSEGRLPDALPSGLHGHAYLLRDATTRPLVAPGALLLGDAAGLAYPRSGEGIRPAVDSGLLAAGALASAAVLDARTRVEGYRRAVEGRLGAAGRRRGPGVTDLLPAPAAGWLAGRLFATRWFSQRVVVDRWFTHRFDPALEPPGLAATDFPRARR